MTQISNPIWTTLVFATVAAVPSIACAASSIGVPGSDEGLSIQGRILYEGVAVEAPGPGGADFEFRLFDAESGGSILAGPILAEEVVVRAGLFQERVDFGVASDEQDRWVEIRVDLPFDEPTGFITLAQRHPIGRVPVAEFALNGADTNSNGDWVFVDGFVGIGTDTPDRELVVAGNALVTDTNGTGGVLDIDSSVERKLRFSHLAPPFNYHDWGIFIAGSDLFGQLGLGVKNETTDRYLVFLDQVGRIGVNITNPSYSLDVSRQGSDGDSAGPFRSRSPTPSIPAIVASNFGNGAELLRLECHVPWIVEQASPSAPNADIRLRPAVYNSGTSFLIGPVEGNTVLQIDPQIERRQIVIGRSGLEDDNVRLFVYGDTFIEGDLEVVGEAYKTRGGEWASLSDRRLKKTINPIQGSLERLMRLSGVTYELRGQYGEADPGRHAGFIAQDVAKVFPTWVRQHGEHLTVKPRGIDAMLVEAIRDLRAEKDAQIAELRGEKDAEIDQLRSEIAELRLLIRGNVRQ